VGGEDPGLNSRPEEAVRSANFIQAWLPVASDGAGNGLAVDLAPGRSCTAGQVITLGPDEETQLVPAPSLPAFLDWAAEQIYAGRVTQEGQDVRFQGTASFLDVARSLFY